MNNPILWVLVAVAAAVVAGIVLLLGASPPAGPAPEALIPDAIEGFIMVAKEARIDPPSPNTLGEDYSSHAFYTPAPGGPWSGKIERLGLTIFKFKDPTKISEARALLLQGVQTESLDLDGRTVELAPEPDGVGLFWQHGALFVAIFVSAPSGSEVETETLKSAALAAARAVLAKLPR